MDQDAENIKKCFADQESYSNAKEYLKRLLNYSDFEFMLSAFNAIQEVLNNDKCTPKSRFNCLRFLKSCMATQNQDFIDQVSQSFLNDLKKYVGRPEQGKNILGKQSEEQIDNSFYLMANECIKNWALFYPINTITKKESEFAKAYNELLQRGVKFYGNKYFKLSDAPPQMRNQLAAQFDVNKTAKSGGQSQGSSQQIQKSQSQQQDSPLKQQQKSQNEEQKTQQNVNSQSQQQQQLSKSKVQTPGHQPQISNQEVEQIIYQNINEYNKQQAAIFQILDQQDFLYQTNEEFLKNYYQIEKRMQSLCDFFNKAAENDQLISQIEDETKVEQIFIIVGHIMDIQEIFKRNSQKSLNEMRNQFRQLFYPGSQFKDELVQQQQHEKQQQHQKQQQPQQQQKLQQEQQLQAQQAELTNTKPSVNQKSNQYFSKDAEEFYDQDEHQRQLKLKKALEEEKLQQQQQTSNKKVQEESKQHTLMQKTEQIAFNNNQSIQFKNPFQKQQNNQNQPAQSQITKQLNEKESLESVLNIKQTISHLIPENQQQQQQKINTNIHNQSKFHHVQENIKAVQNFRLNNNKLSSIIYDNTGKSQFKSGIEIKRESSVRDSRVSQQSQFQSQVVFLQKSKQQEELEQQLVKKEKQIHELQDQLKFQQFEDLKQINKEKANLDYQNLKSQYSELQNQLGIGKSESQLLKQDLQEKSNKIQMLQKENQEIQAMVLSRSQHEKQFQSMVGSSNNNVQNLQKEIQQLSESLNEKEMKVIQLTRQSEYEKQNSKSKDDKIETLLKELQQIKIQDYQNHKLQEDLYSCKKDLLERDDKILYLEKLLEEERQNSANLQHQLTQQQLNISQTPQVHNINQKSPLRDNYLQNNNKLKVHQENRRTHNIFMPLDLVHENQAREISNKLQQQNNVQKPITQSKILEFSHEPFEFNNFQQKDLLIKNNNQSINDKELKGFEVLFDQQYFSNLPHMTQQSYNDFRLSCFMQESVLFQNNSLEISQQSTLQQFHDKEYLTIRLVYKNKSRFQFKGMLLNFVGQQNVSLWAKPEPESLKQTLDSQESISQDLVLNFDQVPFHIVMADLKYSITQTQEQVHCSFPLPNSINKYFKIKNIGLKEFKNQWSMLNHTIFKSQEIDIDPELHNSAHKILDYFDGFIEIKKSKGGYGRPDCLTRIGGLIHVQNTGSNILSRVHIMKNHKIIIQLLNSDNKLDQVQENTIDLILQTYIMLFQNLDKFL